MDLTNDFGLKLSLPAISIPSTIIKNDRDYKPATFFEILQEGKPPIYRRYSEFAGLEKNLRKQFSQHKFSFPSKTFLKNNFDPDFIENRRLGLELYLCEICSHEPIFRSLWVQEFLDSRTNPDFAFLVDPAFASWMLVKQTGASAQKSLKQWKRRWLVLKDQQLYYFQSDQDAYALGVVSIQNADVNESHSTNSGANMSLNAKLGTFLMVADSKRTMAKWTRALLTPSQMEELLNKKGALTPPSQLSPSNSNPASARKSSSRKKDPRKLSLTFTGASRERSSLSGLTLASMDDHTDADIVDFDTMTNGEEFELRNALADVLGENTSTKTAGKDPAEQERIRQRRENDALEMENLNKLVKGVVMKRVQHKNDDKNKNEKVWLSRDFENIYRQALAGSGKSLSKLDGELMTTPANQLIKVLIGRQSGALKKLGKSSKDDLYLSLVFKDVTIDYEARDSAERDTWVDLFSFLNDRFSKSLL